LKKIYYFDTLPIRLKPLRFESLTSYLIRLAEGNAIQNVFTLSALFFESFNTMRQLVALVDYPLPSFGSMPKATGCPASKLLATTFFHLGRKFGRSIHSLRTDHFLADSISTHLRYCPACLSESSYYSLTWRFATLLGCSRHGCRLLEQCGHCGNEIPLFSSPLKMSKCSICEMDLRTCRAESLNVEELKVTRSHLLDLEFLLSRNACERDETLLKTVGQRLSKNRSPRIITAKMVARRVGIKPYQVYLVDQGSPKGRSASFQSYVEYARLFGPPLRHLFSVESRREQLSDSKISADVFKPL
jgi:TniQ